MFEQFCIGVNYWASHAGTNMWKQWDRTVVEQNFQVLAENGIDMVRVFPLWPDFQPLTLHYGFANEPVEYCIGEDKLNDTLEGQCGIDPVMAERFGELLKLAQQYHIRLIVSLITGWMSGRMFQPPALSGKNALTDPEVIRWEIRYVRYLVSQFKKYSCIAAWDLGNECNCMGEAKRSEAFVWSTLITNTIRSIDPDRPVLSGLDYARLEGEWTISDQAETLDILTTHPYHIFYTNLDPIDSVRPVLYPVSEVLLYEGIGKKPCLVEEIGSIGYMDHNYDTESRYLRAVLFALWAHNCHGLLWWCAFDQGFLQQNPYDWNKIGSDYGLFQKDRMPKPAAKTVVQFAQTVREIGKLPDRITDAVCIISEGFGEKLSVLADAVFTLGKQAGIDFTFQSCNQPLLQAEAYFVPCMRGFGRSRFMALLDKVRRGAVLYLSVGEEFIRFFPELTGIDVIRRQRGEGAQSVLLDGESLPMPAPYRYQIGKIDGETVFSFEDGSPAMVRHSYGEGKVYCLLAPLEENLISRPYCSGYEKVYKKVMEQVPCQKVLSCDGLITTEHILSVHKRIAVLLNCSEHACRAELNLQTGWRVKKSIFGNPDQINRCDAVVLELERKQ